MQLNYVMHQYGPYADNLNHLLQRLDGHFIRGFGDRFLVVEHEGRFLSCSKQRLMMQEYELLRI
jgi:hypothetical protein